MSRRGRLGLIGRRGEYLEEEFSRKEEERRGAGNCILILPHCAKNGSIFPNNVIKQLVLPPLTSDFKGMAIYRALIIILANFAIAIRAQAPGQAADLWILVVLL